MKKSIRSGLITLSLATLLSACHKPVPADNTSAANTPTSETSIVETHKENFTGLNNSSFETSIFFMNENGDLVSCYDNFNEEENVCYIDDQNMFYYKYSYDYIGQNTIYDFYVKNADTNTIHKIDSLNNFLFMDVFDDTLYLLEMDYDSDQYIELAYDTTNFEPVAGNESFWKKIASYEFVYNYRYPVCAQRSIFENGYILLRKDGAFYKYDGKKVEKTALENNQADIEYYTKDSVIYTVPTDATYNYCDVVRYDFKTQSETVLARGITDFLCGKDNSLYWIVADEHEFGLEAYSLICYSLKDNTSKTLLEAKKHPGTNGYTPFLENITIAGNFLYYIADNGKEIGWYRYDLKSDAEPVAVGPPLQTFDYFRFGTIQALSTTDTCPKCNQVIFKSYCEYFLLNDTISKQSARINDIFYSNVYSDEEVETPILENDCDYHSPQTATSYISSAQILNDRYLTVTTHGYWYGGGVHGFPLFSSYLFQLETGDEITFRDIFPGTEEQLKEIVARKTKENWESYDPEYSPYYGDGDSVYQDAYNLINLDYIPGYFTEDGYVVSYDPYYLGPFSSGFIEVFISYEELGITIFSEK